MTGVTHIPDTGRMKNRSRKERLVHRWALANRQRADELMAQLDERFEQLRASDPERVERIEKLEGEIEEILPFEECGPEHDGPDDESPDGGDPETDGPATTPDVLPSS